MSILKDLTRAVVIIGTLALSGIPAMAETWTKASVMAIDAEQGKITLKHEELVDLKMPAMTMVFAAADKAALAGLAEGDAVEFVAADENGKLMVKSIKKAK